jgi:uroporphyrinogen decarboxylase
MTPIERVVSRLQGKPTDHIPFVPVTTLYGAALANIPLDKYYSNAGLYFKGQQAVVNSIEPDILFGPFTIAYEAEAFGSKLAHFSNNPPNIKNPAISNYMQIKHLELPDINKHAGLNFIIESVRELSSHYKNQIPVAAILTSPTELPALILGIENWIDTLLFHPDEAQHMLKITRQFFIQLADKFHQAGATAMVTMANFCNPTIVTQSIAEKQLFPALQNTYNEAKLPIFVHHGGARLLPFLELFNNLPNVAGFVVDPRDSLADVRLKVGEQAAIMGKLNSSMLPKVPAGIVEKWTNEILEESNKDPRFFFATSNADIPANTPPENLKAIAKTIRKFQS